MPPFLNQANDFNRRGDSPGTSSLAQPGRLSPSPPGSVAPTTNSTTNYSPGSSNTLPSPLTSSIVQGRPDRPPIPPRPRLSPRNQPVATNPATDYLTVASHILVPPPPTSNTLQGKPPPLPPRSRTSQTPDRPPVPPRLHASPRNELATDPTNNYLPVLGFASHNLAPSTPTSDVLQGKPNPPPVPPRLRVAQKPDRPPVPPRPRTSPHNQLRNNPTTDTLHVSGVATHDTLSSFPMSDTLQGRSDHESDPLTPPCIQLHEPPTQGIQHPRTSQKPGYPPVPPLPLTSNRNQLINNLTTTDALPVSGEPPAQGFLEGARDFKIENSVLTNVQGNALMFRFDGPSTEEFKNLFTHHMEAIKDLDRIAMTTNEYGLSQAIRDLPRAKAGYDYYTSSKGRRSVCFKNTRQALLKEIALCATSTSGPRAYLLFGIAGIGKSTVAQTVAEKADTLRLLGASFFFSRDEADRRTAEKFFTSIAFQLCAYDKQFSDAIGAVLTKERGAAATSKDPQEQLTVLILEPLRDIDRSRSLPTVIVVDALDECDVDDGPIVLMALSRLVEELPSFRVVLTTRPQPHLQYLLDRLGAHQVFRMEDIERKVVEGDIRLYLEYNLSPDQVHARLPMLRRKWAANNEEIDSLVKAAGRLFIIASTALLFILDTVACRPESRMKTLQEEFSRNQTPFDTLNDFYTIILRSAVPLGCKRDILERYQAVVGAIVVIKDPLPVEALAKLIGMPEDDIYYVLDNLQSVISLGSNSVPLVYHKSFPDYITDSQRCQDADLHIAPRHHHTRLATRCLYVMNEHLKHNILGLGAVSQYLNNEKALEEEQLSRDSIQRAIPSELQYASVLWAKHVAQANLKDTEFMLELKTFTEEHLLHWFEALSWIRKLDAAHILLGVVLRLEGLNVLNSDTREILSDALRLVSRDYERIQQTALCVYHSALPFTPKETLLFKKYKHEIRLCQTEGGPAKWDTLVAPKKHGDDHVFRVVFATDNSQFASWDKHNMKLWDSASGTPIKTFDGDGIALADDFSVLAVPQDSLVTMYNVSSSAPIASFDRSSTVVKLAISFDGSRLAAGLEDGTICVWDVAKGVPIASFDDYNGGPFAFPHSRMLAFMSKGGINLWNGNIVARLQHEPEKPVKIAFSGDSTRLATLAEKDGQYSLRLWNSENGDFIAVARDVDEELAISTDGSFLATGGWQKKVQVWSGDSLALVDTIPVNRVRSLAFSGDMLAIASSLGDTVTLYDVRRAASIATLRTFSPISLAFSPDGTRLAAGNVLGTVDLWDVPSIRATASTSESQLSAVTALALSWDCSRLASGHRNGSIELWDTGNMRQAIACHKHHSDSVRALAFSPDGNQLASGSDDKKVRFWDGRDGSPTGILEHTFPDWLTSLAFSSSLLAAATDDAITLWDHTSRCLVWTFEQGGYQLSFSLDGSVLVSVSYPGSKVWKVTVWDRENLMVAATFTSEDITILPSPDGSKLAFHGLGSGFKIFDIANKEVISDPENKDLSSVPRLNGIPVWGQDGYDGFCLVGRVSACHDCVPILWIPRDFDVEEFVSQSSTFALASSDGRILFIRPLAN